MQAYPHNSLTACPIGNLTLPTPRISTEKYTYVITLDIPARSTPSSEFPNLKCTDAIFRGRSQARR